MNYLVGNAQHMGNRKEQQDYLAFSDPTDLAFVRHAGLLGFVADGMGGMAYGREASEIAGKTFLRSYEAKSPGESIPGKLKSALEQANQAVLSLINNKGMAKGEVGTTLVAAVIQGNDLYWIAVGDSRIYLFRQGKLLLLNESHTIGKELDREAAEGKISRIQAINDPERHVLSSYLGLEYLPEIDISLVPFHLQPGDRVIVCSDGLFDVLTDNEIMAEIHGDLQGTSERLVQAALSKNYSHQDNVTVIAMGVSLEPSLQPIPQTRKGLKPPPPKNRLAWLIIFLLVALIIVVAIYWLSKGKTVEPGKSPARKTPAGMTDNREKQIEEKKKIKKENQATPGKESMKTGDIQKPKKHKNTL